MKQLYAIIMSTGDRDDYNREIVYVTEDFEKGSAYVNEHNTRFEALQQKVSSFYNNEYEQWKRANPRPEPAGFNLHPIPKWRGDEPITQDMRDEREALNLKNWHITQKANEPVVQWNEAHTLFIKTWFETHLTPEEILLRQNSNDNHWDIEEVRWL